MIRSTASSARLALVASILVTPSIAAHADIRDFALGSDLEGGIAAVSFIIRTGQSSYLSFNEGMEISVGGKGQGRAEHSGTLEWEGETYDWGFNFSVTGETSTSPWSLTNTSADARVYIQSIILFLDRSDSAIDDGSEPSTPGSGPGFPEAIHLSGPEIFHTSWEIPWESPLNAGDLWKVVLVQWAELPNYDVFPAGATSTWLLDSDIAPAPGVGAMLMIGLMTARTRRRDR